MPYVEPNTVPRISRIAANWIRAVYGKVLSPFLHAFSSVLTGGKGLGCRYEPTCGEYFAQAVEKRGLWKGARLGVGRVCRCHPWGGFGWDPIK